MWRYQKFLYTEFFFFFFRYWWLENYISIKKWYFIHTFFDYSKYNTCHLLFSKRLNQIQNLPYLNKRLNFSNHYIQINNHIRLSEPQSFVSNNSSVSEGRTFPWHQSIGSVLILYAWDLPMKNFKAAEQFLSLTTI